MKWIRLRNKGSFDIKKSLNLIGASVKTCDNPIGLFGSGTKYALAQALREGITVKICSDGKEYTLFGKKEEFRGQVFDTVAFRSQTGTVIKTGIVSNFGKEDWTDQ